MSPLLSLFNNCFNVLFILVRYVKYVYMNLQSQTNVRKKKKKTKLNLCFKKTNEINKLFKFLRSANQ